MKGKIRYKDSVYPIEHHDDHIGNWYTKGCEAFYELAMLEFIQSLKLSGDFIDVGANIGNHSLFFAVQCGCPVYAFEPVPENIILLKKNVKGHMVTVYGIGLSDKKGKAGYEINKDNMGMCKLIKGDDVEINKLDTIVKRDKIGKVDLLKIDAETYETKILKGALKTITKNRPHIFIEGQTITQRNEYDQILIPLGYTRLLAFNKTPTYYYQP